jgi:deoxyadenosine/deoxycytidine kinase
MANSLPANIRHIAVEGVIGVGKTALCHLLEEPLGARVVLEQADENPFLSRFYENRKHYAFQTQLWFLVSRYRQISEAFVQEDLFHSVTLADYMFAKDRIFAVINLNDDELALYDSIAHNLERDIPRPDLVVYLQASTDTLLRRIAKRGRSFESGLDRGYLETVTEAYNHFFFHYTASPVLIVNTNDIDFVENEGELDDLAAQIIQARPGINFYHPVRPGKRKSDKPKG